MEDDGITRAFLLRRLAFGGFLRAFRGARGISAEAAAAEAGLGHMTWRRLEDGYSVRPKTYATLETTLDLPTGTLTRALSDNSAMVALAARLGIDTSTASNLHSFLTSFAGPYWLSMTLSGDSYAPVAALINGAPDPVAPGSVQNLINCLVRIPDRTPIEDAVLSALLAWMDELVIDREQSILSLKGSLLSLYGAGD